jgi:hypothetical protein
MRTKDTTKTQGECKDAAAGQEIQQKVALHEGIKDTITINKDRVSSKDNKASDLFF